MSRIFALDILRIISALVIFVFHSSRNMNCSYGPFQPFCEQGAVFMVLFFMLSGFVMYMQSYKKDMMNIHAMKTYYIKRIGAIYPLYIVIVFLYEIISHKTPLKEFLILLPIESLLFQSNISGLFNYTHNGGTWFVSCIAFCILLSPFLCSTIKALMMKSKIAFFFVISLISIYTPLLVRYFDLPHVYNNTVLRGIEYCIGMLLADFYIHTCEIHTRKKKTASKIVVAFAWLFLFSLVTLLSSKGIGTLREYNFISVPAFAVILFLTPYAFNISLSPKAASVLGYINSLCYPFFMAQFFTWRLTRFLGPIIFAEAYTGNFANKIRILLSFIICSLLSVLFNETICKPSSKLIGNYLKKKSPAI